jgi:hypothetical protein
VEFNAATALVGPTVGAENRADEFARFNVNIKAGCRARSPEDEVNLGVRLNNNVSPLTAARPDW